MSYENTDEQDAPSIDLLYAEIGKKQIRLQQCEKLLRDVYNENYIENINQWDGSPLQKQLQNILGA